MEMTIDEKVVNDIRSERAKGRNNEESNYEEALDALVERYNKLVHQHRTLQMDYFKLQYQISLAFDSEEDIVPLEKSIHDEMTEQAADDAKQIQALQQIIWDLEEALDNTKREADDARFKLQQIQTIVSNG